MLRSSAGWLANRTVFPTSLRAVLGYYARSGVFDIQGIRLKMHVDDVTEDMIDQTFADVKTAIAEEVRQEPADFSYDTKLILPAKLTLGYAYRTVLRETSCDFTALSAPPEERMDLVEPETLERIERAERMTHLVIAALIDGDMRDAINDSEFEDFEVDLSGGAVDDARMVATTAQRAVENSLEQHFSTFPEAVESAYRHAVDWSERHQDRDGYFRRLYRDARDGDEEALARIRAEYKRASFEERPDVFDAEHTDIPYLKTQYARVGVIYDGMIEMFRAADIRIEESFKRSIIFAIIAAQIWLDDVSDFAADERAGQLTPVTAEYLLAETEPSAYDTVVSITATYLSAARDYAGDADSTLTGIATEYIHGSGRPEELPGS